MTLWSGGVYVYENTLDDDYDLVWQDSLPFVNLKHLQEGDVDRDGKMEFYIGASSSNGNWTIMYESDGDNHYVPRLIFNLLAGGLFDNPSYQVADIDSDSLDELVIRSGTYLFVFKSVGNDKFSLWYLRDEGTTGQVRFSDFDDDGRMDFVFSKKEFSSNDLRLYSDVYRGTPLVTNVSSPEDQLISAQLLGSFPNPFNSSTTLHYSIPQPQWGRLSIYSISGRLLVTLYEGELQEGKHEMMWDARAFASGIYIVELATRTSYTYTKVIMIK